MSAPRRPYRGSRGDYVVEQKCGDTWVVCEGASTEDRARAKGRRYRSETRVTPNRPGDPVREGSYRP